MTETRLSAIEPGELAACAPPDPDAGLGTLRTSAGNLPLRSLGLRARITGLSSRVVLTQRFGNPHAEPLEATYIFPLPDRGAVTALRMTAGDRTVVASLREREQARREYEEAIAAGRRASIAEEERPDVFTLRVGNILPGEEVTVELTIVGVLPVADGAATFRFPLVVAPRYVPGSPLPGDAVGAGWQPDTDAVPDASRVSPPVLLPGFPHPVRLDAEVEIDPAGLEMGPPRASLHAVRVDGGRVRVEPGERPDRDLVLRIPLGRPSEADAALCLVPDGTGSAGTFELTVLPPDLAAVPRPRDVVLLLDRSGSMSGWKIVAARRAAARIVDTLTDADRFAVLAFDDQVDTPGGLPGGLWPGSDRNRFRAVEFLAGLTARGGTELSGPLGRGLGLLLQKETPGGGAAGGQEEPPRDRVLVLVTDGQVAGEDRLLRTHAAQIGEVRLHTVGIDQAVNAGFLGRLASLGGGRCELVESEDRLDEAMDNIHRRIGSPLVTGIEVGFEGLAPEPGSITPLRLPDLFAGVPYVVRGRYSSAGDAMATLRGTAPDGRSYVVQAMGRVRSEPALPVAWARARLRDLEDRYASSAAGHVGLEEPAGLDELERRIVALSLRFGVLCRFTAFVAIDDRVVTDGSAPRGIVQPVPLPAGWEAPHLGAVAPMAMRLTSTSFAGLPPAVGGAPAPLARATGVARAAGAVRAAFAGRDDGSAADDHALTRHLLATEAARLRELSGAPEHRRREALLDLGSRLTPLAKGSGEQRWRDLLDLLRPERVASEPVSELWPAILALLDALAGGAASGTDGMSGAGTATGGASRGGIGTRRSGFWKRPPPA